MRVLYLFFLMIVFAIATFGQIKNTENTVKLAEGQASEKATLADIAWLAGSWTGSGFDGVNEEVWSRPNAGVMMGMYRLIEKDKSVFFEMMMLVEKEGTLLLRLKHFNPDFTGWEEKDKTTDFKFVNKSGKRMNFAGLTYEQVGDKKLKIYLALRQKDGSIKEETFLLTRSK